MTPMDVRGSSARDAGSLQPCDVSVGPSPSVTNAGHAHETNRHAFAVCRYDNIGLSGDYAVNHIVVRTHGGLRHQIFTLLYMRLHANWIGASLYEMPDLRYVHGCARNVETVCAPAPSRFQRAVPVMRLPKALTRAGQRTRLSSFRCSDGKAASLWQRCCADTKTLNRVRCVSGSLMSSKG